MKNVVTTSKQGESRREIIKDSNISLQDENGIIELYDSLVSAEFLAPIDVKKVYEAFPVFEATIGEEAFKKVKKYFGIGTNKFKNVPRSTEIQIKLFLDKLRTIENAQYYIKDFNKLIKNTAAKLYGAPEYMSDIVKAKIVRMYTTIFMNNFFMTEDMDFSDNGKAAVSALQFRCNSLKMASPEELFTLFRCVIDRFSNDSLIYDVIMYEMSCLEKSVRNEILEFAELRLVKQNGKECFISVNKSMQNPTFKNIRNIKKRVFKLPAIMEPYRFAYKTNIEEMTFDGMYQIYKSLINLKFEDAPTIYVKRVFIEGNSIIEKNIECREIYKSEDGATIVVSSEEEVKRIICSFEIAARNGITMKAMTANEKREYSVIDIPIALYLGAIKFAQSQRYLDITSSIERDYEIANALIGIDDSYEKDFIAYMCDEITAERLKEELNISSKFESDVLGLEKEETLLDASIRFAEECGYLKDISKISEELINEVFIPNNELEIQKFSKGEISKETLKKKIGFSEEFATMFFDLSKVDVVAIETKLQEFKKERAGKNTIQKSALLINLYCYLVQNQVKCGPKNKAPKGNKSLKPKNLLAMIA